MINGMRLFLFLLAVRAHTQSMLASGFVIRNNDFKPLAATDNSNKKFVSNSSHIMKAFCKLHPQYVWCRNIDTTTSPTATTEDENIPTMRVKNFTVSVNSPTTTIINNWSTSDYYSLDSVTNNATSETANTTIINDHDDLTTSPMTYYTDDTVSITTTPKSTTNYEPDSTASSVDPNILNNVTSIKTTTSVPADYTNSAISSTESTTTTKTLDNVTLIETTASDSTDFTNSAISSTESTTTTKTLDNVTLIETTASDSTDYTNSAISSTESTITTQVFDNTSFGIQEADLTCHTNFICSLISLVIKYFCDCLKLHNFC